MPTATPEVKGTRYGRLVVLGEAPRQGTARRIRVRCDCGVVKTVRLANLRFGCTKSCGCARGMPNWTPDKTKGCVVCRHPKRKGIEHALKLSMSIPAVASKFGMKESAISYHRTHHMTRVPSAPRGGRTRRGAAITVGQHVPLPPRNANRGMDLIVLHVAPDAAIPHRVSSLIDGDQFRTDTDVLLTCLLRGLATVEREHQPCKMPKETGVPAFPIRRMHRVEGDIQEALAM